VLNRRILALLVASSGFGVESASAQQIGNQIAIETVVPQDFNRGHNVSVQEQRRPDYTALGVGLGGLVLYPQIALGSGATTNTYLTSQDTNSSLFLYEAASARLESRWSRHLLRISASSTNREYIGESQRNEHLWNINANGRLDINSSVKLAGSASSSRRFENILSGEVTPTVAALSKYKTDLSSLALTYTSGRFRTILAADHRRLDFSSVPLRSGGEIDQNFRDRKVTQAAVQFEYSKSPSVSFFAQISGGRTQYSQPLPSGQEALDSKSVRVLAGVNVDISGYWRGSVGVGYITQDYKSSGYKTIGGLSGEVNVDVFFTPRLTLGVTGRRIIRDVFDGSPMPSFDTSAAVSTDYELLSNMIISASMEYLQQSIGRKRIRAAASSRYLISRRLNLDGMLSYSRRSPNSFNETRLEFSLAYQL
jgi:hypothetical protein